MVSFDKCQLAVIDRLIKEGKNSDELAKEFHCHKRTIQRMKARKTKHGDVSYRKSSGRPRKTTPRQDRKVILAVRKTPEASQRQVSQTIQETTGVSLSRRTVVKRLLEEQIHQATLKEKPKLTDWHRKRRYEWAANLIAKEPSDFFPYLFTDEVRICLYSSDSRRRVAWLKPSELTLKSNVKGTLKHPPWLHVWAGICLNGRTKLGFLSKNVDSYEYCHLLRTHYLPEVQRLGVDGRLILLQDGAPCHRSAHTRAFMESNDIVTAPHPSQSPDMNPIEHVWPHLKRAVAKTTCNTLKTLQETVIKEWNNLPAQLIQNLCLSYSRRIRACYDAKGGNTRY